MDVKDAVFPGQPLDQLKFHAETTAPGVGQRFVLLSEATSGEAGVFVTTRHFQDAGEAPDAAAEPHTHDALQLFLVLGQPGALRVRATVGETETEIASPASICALPGVPHQVTVLGGTGALVSVLFDTDYA